MSEAMAGGSGELRGFAVEDADVGEARDALGRGGLLLILDGERHDDGGETGVGDDAGDARGHGKWRGSGDVANFEGSGRWGQGGDF